jgi:tripartite-type tricarboxylate transporter receptor subunit TctC
VLPPIAIQPALAKTAYDPVKDFAPITAVGTNSFVLVVNKNMPVTTVAEFVDHIRSQPGSGALSAR